MRIWPLCLIMVACAQPDYPDNPGCGEAGECPPGQICNALGLCAPEPVGTAGSTDLDAGAEEDLPQTQLDLIPPATTNAQLARFRFSGSVADAGFTCRVDDRASEPCTSPYEVTLGEGEHLFLVAADGDATPAEHHWRIDLTPPETTVTTGPSGPVPRSDVAFDFGSDEPATWECRLDAEVFLPCAPPVALAALADGPHSFSVRAIDAAGNVDGSPVVNGFTVDTQAPDTAITSAPSGPVGATTATVQFTSVDAARFECALDDSDWFNCASPWSQSGLGAGTHIFQVRAVDAAGNPDATQALASWTIDTQIPDTTITSGPAAATRQTSTSFAFDGSKPGSTFACRADAAAFAACTSPKAVGPLAEGSHTWDVRATDPAGNLDPTPASWSWTINLTAPATTLDPAPATTGASATFTFSSEPGAIFECALDAAAYAPCSSPLVLSALVAGSRTLSVRAVDAAGNPDATPAVKSWTVDVTAPMTSLSAIATATGPSVTATFSADEPATFECALDGAAYQSCVSPLALSGLAGGGHGFAVRATDAAGNVDSTPATTSWTVDATPPITTLGAIPAVTAPSLSVTFSANEASTFECAVDAGGFATCTSPRALAGLSSGPHTFRVRATDAVGNAESPGPSAAWSVDANVPDTTIVTKPSALTSAKTAAFTYTSSKAGSTFTCTLDGGAPFACAASGYTTPTLGEGAHTFTVYATDANGLADPSPASHGWQVDSVAPPTTLGTSPPTYSASRSATFQFSSTDSSAVFECALDTSTFTACASPLSYSNLSEAPHNFKVRAKDAAGNFDQTPATRDWTIDVTAPDTVLTAGPGPYTQTRASIFRFTGVPAGDASQFKCRYTRDGNAPIAWATCVSDTAPWSGLADGHYVMEVQAMDLAGNLDATPAIMGWTIDNVAPNTIIDTQPPATGSNHSVTITYHSTEGGSFKCWLDTAAPGTCSGPAEYFSLPNGPHTFSVYATDFAGNADASPAIASFTLTP